MLVADEFLGTLEDEALAARAEREGHLAVVVDGTERRRSRVRTTAEDGTEIGIAVGRELRDGDVLAAGDRLVVVSLAARTAMVLDFAEAGDATLLALRLGHAVGNRHWDLAVEGGRAYLPVTDSRERMEATVDPFLPDGVTVDYDDVPPTLFDDGDPTGHGRHHTHESDHGRSHSHGGRRGDPGARTADRGGGEP